MLMDSLKTIYLISFLFLLQSCAVNQEPIRYGNDSCEHCKMLIMDPKFGAEIVTGKGKIYKFDDINCMVTFMNQKSHDESALPYILVIDYLTTEILIDATTAFYAYSENVKSPMAGGVAAFHTQDAMQRFIIQNGGTILSWQEVKDKFK